MTTINCSECGKATEEGDRISHYRGNSIVKVQHRKCSDDADRAKFTRTGHLNTSLLTAATLSTMRAGLHAWGVDDDICGASDRLQEDVKRFCIEAWFGGVASVKEKHICSQVSFVLAYPRTKRSLQSIIEDSPHRTLTAKFGDVLVSGQEMAGRALIELENATARITLITAAKEKTARMGIQGIDGTEDECRKMINAVRENWRDLNFVKATD